MTRSRLVLAAVLALLVASVSSSTAADTLDVHLVSQTTNSITLGWTPQPGYGYLFFNDCATIDSCTLVSRTNDPARSTVKFAKGHDGYKVAVITEGNRGLYTSTTPPPPGDTTPPTVTMTAPANGATVSGTITSSATATDNVGVARVEFFHDGISYGQDTTAPYSVQFDTTTVANGPHTFGARAYDAAGNVGLAAAATANVSNSVVPPTGNVFISPLGADSNPCTSALPCRTFTRGYAAAAEGNTVSVANGSYPGVSFTGTKNVTFQVDSGTATLTGQLDFNHGANVTVVGPLTVASGSNDFDVRAECANNITLRNVSGRLIWIYNGSSNISFYGGRWGGYTGIEDSAVSGYNGGGSSNCSLQGDGIVRNVLFDGVNFHDVNYGPSSTWGGAHPDCLQLMGGIDGLAVRNSVIERCGNTFFGWYPDFGDNRNLLVENNLFRAVYESSWSMQIGYKPTGDCSIVFRYNTVDTSVGNSDVPPLIRCRLGESVYGNIITHGIGSDPVYCVPGFAYNVYEQGACGTNAVTGNPGWVARSTSATSAYDYHLAAGALALGKGDPARFPGTDFEGTVRSAPPDAGYDER